MQDGSNKSQIVVALAREVEKTKEQALSQIADGAVNAASSALEEGLEEKQEITIDGIAQLTFDVPQGVGSSTLHFVLSPDSSKSTGHDFPALLEQYATIIAKAKEKYPDNQIKFHLVKCAGQAKDVKVLEGLDAPSLADLQAFFGQPGGETPAATALEKICDLEERILDSDPNAKVIRIISTDGKPTAPTENFNNTLEGKAHRNAVMRLRGKPSTPEMLKKYEGYVRNEYQTVAKTCQQRLQKHRNRIFCISIGIGPEASPERIAAAVGLARSKSLFLYIPTKDLKIAQHLNYQNIEYPHTLEEVAKKVIDFIPFVETCPTVEIPPGVSGLSVLEDPIYLGMVDDRARYGVPVAYTGDPARFKAADISLLNMQGQVPLPVKVLEMPARQVLLGMAQRRREAAAASNYVDDNGEKANVSKIADTLKVQIQAGFPGLLRSKEQSSVKGRKLFRASCQEAQRQLANVVRIYGKSEAERARQTNHALLESFIDRSAQIDAQHEKDLAGQVAARNSIRDTTTMDEFVTFLADNERIKEQITLTRAHHDLLQTQYTDAIVGVKGAVDVIELGRREKIMQAELASVQGFTAWLESLLQLPVVDRENIDFVKATASQLVGIPIYARDKAKVNLKEGELPTLERNVTFSGELEIDPRKQVSLADVHLPLGVELANEYAKIYEGQALPDNKHESSAPPGKRLAGILFPGGLTFGSTDCVGGFFKSAIFSAANTRIPTQFFDCAQHGDYTVYKSWLPFKLFIDSLLRTPGAHYEPNASVDGLTTAERANRGSDAYTRLTESGKRFMTAISQKGGISKCHPNEFLLFLTASSTLGHLLSQQDNLPDNWSERATAPISSSSKAENKQEDAPKKLKKRHKKKQANGGQGPVKSLAELVQLGFGEMVFSYAEERKTTAEGEQGVTNESIVGRVAESLHGLEPAKQTDALLTYIFGGTSREHLKPLRALIASSMFARQKLASLQRLRSEISSAADAEIAYDPNPDAEKVDNLMSKIGDDPAKLLVYFGREILGIQGNDTKLLNTLNGMLLFGISGEYHKLSDMAADFKEAVSEKVKAAEEAKQLALEEEEIAKYKADPGRQAKMLQQFADKLEEWRQELQQTGWWNEDAIKQQIESMFDGCNEFTTEEYQAEGEMFPNKELAIAELCAQCERFGPSLAGWLSRLFPAVVAGRPVAPIPDAKLNPPQALPYLSPDECVKAKDKFSILETCLYRFSMSKGLFLKLQKSTYIGGMQNGPPSAAELHTFFDRVATTLSQSQRPMGAGIGQPNPKLAKNFFGVLYKFVFSASQGNPAVFVALVKDLEAKLNLPSPLIADAQAAGVQGGYTQEQLQRARTMLQARPVVVPPQPVQPAPVAPQPTAQQQEGAVLPLSEFCLGLLDASKNFKTSEITLDIGVSTAPLSSLPGSRFLSKIIGGRYRFNEAARAAPIPIPLPSADVLTGPMSHWGSSKPNGATATAAVFVSQPNFVA